MRMTNVGLLLLAAALAAVAGRAAAANENFPHRAKFKDVPVIEAEELYAGLDRYLLIDVRSKYEYRTMHIKGAQHVPLGSDKFIDEVQKLRAATPRPIVFYCNGVTCKKSYEAVEKARAAGLADCRAYDAGLHTWAKRYPDQSVLLGQSPMRAADFLELGAFKARVLPADEFESRIGPAAVVLDIRDRRQRDMQLFPFQESRAELDETDRIAALVQDAKRQNKTLLVYDKSGRQAPWFQYYLEKQGFKDYYFLDGGAEGYFEAKYGKLKVRAPEG